MTVNERAEKIYTTCRAAGMTHAGAIGTLGNLQGETHDFDPMSLETMYRNRFKLTDTEYVRRADAGEKVYSNYYFTHDNAGFGIVQWTWWSRKKGLLDYAKSKGKSVGDLDIQIAYMLHELKTSYTKAWKILCATDSILATVQTLVIDYEKPANQSTAIQIRRGYAENWLKLIKNEVVTPDKPDTEDNSDIKRYDRQKVIDMATSQIGYLEHASDTDLDNPTANYGTKNHNKYARDLDLINTFYNYQDKCGHAWCDIFVDWNFVACFGVKAALELLCQPEKSSGAGCEFSRNYYQRAGRLDTTPEIGAQAFFPQFGTPSHTGLVVEIDGNCIWTIEGNTTGIVDGKQREGVFKKMHYRSEIQSYGHPAYNDGYGTDDYVGGKQEDKKPDPVEPTKPDTDTEKVSECEVKLNVLKKGSMGKDVKALQILLIGNGYSCGSSKDDGDFGTATDSAVKKYQKAMGLSVDGIVGKNTWTKLLKG